MKFTTWKAEYTAWRGIKQRCYDKNCQSYRYYGGRGILVCERWLAGEAGKHPFMCFLEDMGQKPTSSHMIDRIDNDGNYEPKNCRWTTKSEQMLNRGIWNRHGHKYVRKWGNKFAANIRINGRTIYLGLFATAAEASAAGASYKRSTCHL